MSTADHFKYPRPFPFCPPPVYGKLIGGLTLAQAMDYWWLIEDVQISAALALETTEGAFDVAGTLRLNPAGATGFFADSGAWLFDGSAMHPDTLGEWSDLPAVKAPRERVCAEHYAARENCWTNLAMGYDDGSVEWGFGLMSEVGIDPDDGTKFALGAFPGVYVSYYVAGIGGVNFRPDAYGAYSILLDGQAIPARADISLPGGSLVSWSASLSIVLARFSF